ncbi:MAG TPA: PQQ-dependent sugar dehydrogenase, partial [Gemmatimonadaceae bacterium]
MHRTLRTVAGLIVAAGVPTLTAARAQTPTPNVITTQAGSVTIEQLAQLEHPWGMAYLPDGRLLVTEKPGRLRFFANGTLSDPITGVPEVAFRGQGGLADVAVDPDFANNQTIYLSYAEAAPRQPPNARNPADPRIPGDDTTDVTLKGLAVARARLEGTQLQDVRVIWRQDPKTTGRGHFGGRMVFGPDGKLYISSSDRMRFDPAQDTASNLGKVVRINPDGSIPDDNPLVRLAEASRDVWTIGHRNVLGIAVEPGTGRIWAHEMGPLGGDEVNIIEGGKNYGWPEVSNGENYDGSHIPPHATSESFTPPAHAWDPVVSPSGLVFYTDSLFSAWRGSMLLGGLSSQSLVRLTFDDRRLVNEERIYLGMRIRDVEQAPDGAILLLTDGPDGALLRLTPQRGGGGGNGAA